MSSYPEHERLAEVADKSHIIGEFLQWLDTTIWADTANVYDLNDRVQEVLAEYFNIDLAKIDKEKDQMLEEFREQNGTENS